MGLRLTRVDAPRKADYGANTSVKLSAYIGSFRHSSSRHRTKDAPWPFLDVEYPFNIQTRRCCTLSPPIIVLFKGSDCLPL